MSRPRQLALKHDVELIVFQPDQKYFLNGELRVASDGLLNLSQWVPVMVDLIPA